METFIPAKLLVENRHYHDQRQSNLARRHDEMIDPPIISLINTMNALPQCFTLQSCYGHFVYSGQDDIRNIDPLPATDTMGPVEYRIAYIAFCIENSLPGKALLGALQEIPDIDPENIQFGCADWFWNRQINSYVLQVEPERFKYQDRAILEYNESLIIETTRQAFFARLDELLHHL